MMSKTVTCDQCGADRIDDEPHECSQIPEKRECPDCGTLYREGERHACAERSVDCPYCPGIIYPGEPHECRTRFSTPRRSYPGGALKYINDNEILREANTAVTDRAGVYGDANAMAAEMFSAYLGVDVTERDVCALMILLKTARRKATPDHRDSWVDIAGYAALGGGAER